MTKANLSACVAYLYIVIQNEQTDCWVHTLVHLNCFNVVVVIFFYLCLSLFVFVCLFVCLFVLFVFLFCFLGFFVFLLLFFCCCFCFVLLFCWFVFVVVFFCFFCLFFFCCCYFSYQFQIDGFADVIINGHLKGEKYDILK